MQKIYLSLIVSTLCCFNSQAQVPESCAALYAQKVQNTQTQKLLQGSIESDDDGNILGLKHDAVEKDVYVKVIALFNEWNRGQGINYWDPSDSHADFEVHSVKNAEGLEIGYEFRVVASDLRSILYALVENNRVKGYHIRARRDDHRIHKEMCRE